MNRSLQIRLCQRLKLLKECLPFVGLIEPALPMRIELLFDCLRQVPQGNAAWQIEHFTTTMRGDREYRAGLGKIMRSWESSADRRRPQSTELSARIPPFREIHLAYPSHDQPQLQEPIKIDFSR